MEEKSIKQIREAGVEIDKVADKKAFQDAVRPVWDKYGKQHAALIERIQAVR
jgi:TRAP-type C4-dicarboxylate transport system substrate-binding protein